MEKNKYEANIITAIVQRAPFWIHNEWSF
jgi:hypothetical protein